MKNLSNLSNLAVYLEIDTDKVLGNGVLVQTFRKIKAIADALHFVCIEPNIWEYHGDDNDFVAFGKFCVGLFLDDASEAAFEAGTRMLLIVAPFYFVISPKIVSDGALRGAGAMKMFMLSTFTDLITRVMFVFILSSLVGTEGIWWSWPIGWFLGSAVAVTCYFSGKWKKYSKLIVG